MSVNCSSSSDSPRPSHLSLHYSYLYCLISRPSSFIFTTFSITTTLLLLPLCIFILHHGLQQWRQKCSTSSAATVSHSDCFTYHVVAMELVGICGSVVGCWGVYIEDLDKLFVGTLLFGFTWFGETFFHVLTCVERYLAVVHPITYLSLRNQRGIRIRNISITCVWLLCFAGTVLVLMKNIFIFDFFFLVISFTITSFCSLSVLRVLIRPGPGEQGGGRERVDQSKKKAFYTILAILGMLVLRVIGNLVMAALYVLTDRRECLIMTCEYWLNLPSTLVLPVLFLGRAGKLVCCKKNVQ